LEIARGGGTDREKVRSGGERKRKLLFLQHPHAQQCYVHLHTTQHPFSIVIIPLEVHRRHEERQHATCEAVFRVADVDVEDGAVAVTEACGGREGKDEAFHRTDEVMAETEGKRGRQEARRKENADAQAIVVVAIPYAPRNLSRFFVSSVTEKNLQGSSSEAAAAAISTGREGNQYLFEREDETR
jgi:hypothetical protein